MNPPYDLPPLNRREMLTRCGMGMGAMMAGSLAHSASEGGPLQPKASHFPGRIKRVIHLFMNGGPSQVDTFDPKPALDKWNGKKIPSHLPTERPTGAAMASPFKFQKYGQSGLPVSDLFTKTAKAAADDLCVIRSMQANVPNHEPSLMLMNCGDSQFNRPSMGSWVAYGLGTENQNLPAFVVLCSGLPTKGSSNWRASFLPGSFQATHINLKGKKPGDELIPYLRNRRLDPVKQRQQLDFLQQLNQRHLATRQNDAHLESRLQTFELAYRMQLEASDALDIGKEPKYIRELYGNTPQAREILTARRLIERGVRFVQVWHGSGQPWDSHSNIASGHKKLGADCDQAIGALLFDLKQRGLLDETLVVWGGEFGRTPTVELPMSGTGIKTPSGRDHNHYGFSMWLAGGGVKPGVFGATDEFGFKAVEDSVHVHDLHATILHLLGFDHTKLTYRYAGRDFRLTDIHGNVVHQILA
jgi:hypothetical protein